MPISHDADNSRVRTLIANTGEIQKDASKDGISDLRPKRPRRPSSRLAYSLRRLGRTTDVSVKLLYLEISAGRLVARKVGRRTIVRRADAIKWLRSLPVLSTADQHDIPT
jgi:hypothetical protein